MTLLAVIVGLMILPFVCSKLFNMLTGSTRANVHYAGLLGVTLLFCFTGFGHFYVTNTMAGMMPPWIPARVPLVYITGVIEFAAALALLVPTWRVRTGWFLIVLLALFLPVNIYAALMRIPIAGHEWGPLYLLIRVPFQAFLAWWIWYFAVRQPTRTATDNVR
jgi:uncharacterized membrane protein